MKPLLAGYLPVTSQNYELAKAALAGYYRNLRKVAQTHVSNLINAPCMSPSFKVEELSNLVRIFSANSAAEGNGI